MRKTTRLTLIGVAIGLAVVAGAWRPVAAQGTRGDDVLASLLVEVKGLRAAMEQMASAGTHAQLLVGRLQLQEGRIAGMIRRLDTVRDARAAAQREYDQIRGSLHMLGADGPGQDSPQEDTQHLFGGLRQQVAASKANVDRLATEEAQLTADLSTEQARWIDINQRLDELERSLGKR